MRDDIVEQTYSILAFLYRLLPTSIISMPL
jgi:hypothetical protein